MKTRFIVNSRSGRAARAASAVRGFATQRGAGVVHTQRAGHAADLARAAIAEGCELIVAVGGDGTMNEVASALVGTGRVLGLIPCGSGDGLGRHLGVHGPVRHALDVLVTGEPRSIDAGVANGHPFFTVAGLGFEAEIAARFNRLTSRGFLRYLSTSFALYRKWPPTRYHIATAGQELEVDAFTLAVANACQYGNNARIAPRARVDDGLLELTAVPPVTWRNAAPLALRLFLGGLHRANGVLTRSCPAFTVRMPVPGHLQTDGEVHATGAVVEFGVRPGALRIMVPAPNRRG